MKKDTMGRKLSAPTTIQLEITDVCNERCRHCYNFWRHENSRQNQLNKEKLDRLIDMFIEAGIFHVILTGGEPFHRFDLLEYGFRRLLDNNISISCNSNLTLATEDKLKRLADIGLDHILTSLNSHDPETNDYIVNRKGAFRAIVKSIECAVKSGIRISANMIISRNNRDHVYLTARLAHELGCQKIFGTRVVPSVYERNPNESEFMVTREETLGTLDQLLRAKEETGILIGTLVSYPLCLLSDLERYRDFVGRGCPGQSGHLMSINADGETHACVHQEKGYGNVFEIGIAKAYREMSDWHDRSYHYRGCDGCSYIGLCQTGCRMSALGFGGSLDDKDNLMADGGTTAIVKPYRIVQDPNLLRQIDSGLRFCVPKRLRFRNENGFTLVNIRWANTITCPSDVAEFLNKYQSSGKTFDIHDFGTDKRELLADLFFKDAVECEDFSAEFGRKLLGLSADIR